MGFLKNIFFIILLPFLPSAIQLCEAQSNELSRAQNTFDNLIQTIRTGNAYQRAEAIPAFACIDDPRVVLVLMDLLKDEDSRVRVYAAQQLARLADSRSADALAKALGDSYGNVRRYAAEGLAKVGNERHVPALVAAVMNHLPDTNTSDRESWYSMPALEAIGKLSSKPPPQLMKLVRRISDENFAKDEDWWQLLEAVAMCLGQIGDKAAYDHLQQAREALEKNYQDYKTWYAVREALAKIDPEKSRFDRPAADILTTVRIYMASYKEIRQKWVQQLGNIGLIVIEDLEWTLRFRENRNWDSERTLVAIETLGEIGGAGATKVLRQYIERQLRQAELDAQGLVQMRGYRLRMPMLALLQAEPTTQTAEYVLSLLPSLNDFEQEYFIGEAFHIKPEKIPQEIKVFLYSKILLSQRKTKPVGRYAPSAAANFLGQIGGEEAGQALSEALLKSEYAEIRDAAARALGCIKDYDAIPALIKAAELSNAPIGTIARAIGAINDKRALPALENLQSRERLEQKDRVCIAAALARLGKDYDQNAAIVRKALPDSLELAQWLHDTETVKAVAAFVEDQQDYTRQRAISTLEANGTVEAFNVLRGFVDPQKTVEFERLEQLSDAATRMAEKLGDDSKDYYLEIATVSRAVRGWFVITAMAQPHPESRDTYELVKRRSALARRVWIVEATRRLDLAAKGEKEIWQCDIPEQAIRALEDIFAPDLVPVLQRIVRESGAKVSFHGKYKMVDFYHIRSLAAEILSKKTGRPYSFIDADGRSHPGGWNPSHEQ